MNVSGEWESFAAMKFDVQGAGCDVGAVGGFNPDSTAGQLHSATFSELVSDVTRIRNPITA